MDKKKMVGMVIADRNEFAPIAAMANTTETAHGMTRCTLEVGQVTLMAYWCGIGMVNAATAATCLAMEGATAIFSVGYSGGMNGVVRDQTVAGTRFVEHDFDLTPLGHEKGVKPDQQYLYDADAHLCEVIASVFPDMKMGAMVSGDCFVCSDALREELIDRYDAISCDMETAAVASVCHRFELPFAAIRRISDDAGDHADDLYRDAVNVHEQALMDMALAVIERME